jgi:protein-S-isoprenylcysteine O-methyltransferase Ste14
MSNPTTAAWAGFAGIMLCWIAFVAVFVFRKKSPRQTEARRDRRSMIGLALQGIAYFLASFQPPHQPFLPPVAALAGWAGIVFSLFTIGLAAGSVWLSAAAVGRLGKQWAYQARVVEGHELIKDGPYAYVRNPIYTAMLGMLVATGLAMEHWIALMIALPIFAIGLMIRVRIEEKLLRATFGTQFEDYAKRVPAVIPGIY